MVGQTAVIVEALSAAGVDPDTIGYVEAHGTGTALGDPAEIAALTKAFRRQTVAPRLLRARVGEDERRPPRRGGGRRRPHQAVLALAERQIPPSLHFESPNPAIDFEASPFYVSTLLRDWPAGSSPRRGGVSAFGVGGTNAHVVVEEAPELPPRPPSRVLQLLPLSARTPAALDAAARRLADHLEAHPEIDLADAAFTLQAGRRAFDHRRFVVARGREDAVRALRALEGLPSARPERRNPPLQAVFGAASPAGGDPPLAEWNELLALEPVFRAAFERGTEAAGPAGRRLRDALAASSSDPRGAAREVRDAGLERLLDLAVADALAAQLRAWGLALEAPAVPGGLPADDGSILVELGAHGVRVGAATPAPGGAEPLAGEDGLLCAVGSLWLAGVEPRWEALHAPRGPPRPAARLPVRARAPLGGAARGGPAGPRAGARPGELALSPDLGAGLARTRAGPARADAGLPGRGWPRRRGRFPVASGRDAGRHRRRGPRLRGRRALGLHDRPVRTRGLPPSLRGAAPGRPAARARPAPLGARRSGRRRVAVGAVPAGERARLLQRARPGGGRGPAPSHPARGGLRPVRGAGRRAPPPRGGAARRGSARRLPGGERAARLGHRPGAPVRGRRRGRAVRAAGARRARDPRRRAPRALLAAAVRARPRRRRRALDPARGAGRVLPGHGRPRRRRVRDRACCSRGRDRAKLVLTTRTALPPRQEWASAPGVPGVTPAALSLRIKKVLALEGLGAEVLVVPADADEPARPGGRGAAGARAFRRG